MWKKWLGHKHVSSAADYGTDDYKALLRYIDGLASHKLGYPVSLLTYLGVVNNKSLGIKSGTIANILLNNVGDPFKDSETSLLEVKKHEREVLAILERYYGVAPDGIRGYVTTGGTEGNFASLWWSKRFLINTLMDVLIENDNLIKLSQKDEQTLAAALVKIPNDNYQLRSDHLQKMLDTNNLIAKYKNIVQEILTPTVFYSRGPTHYSIPKISEILHLNIRTVSGDSDGSIDLNDFKKELIFHLSAHPHSSIIVIANIGTTITGAIDDVPGIKKILDEMVPKPLYTIHMDGALTGFVLPILKPFGEVENYFEALGVNTMAVSAHKYPGLSQPCGIILANKSFFVKAFEKQSERSVDYVGNIIDSTITGSRSGLNVLMLHNALISLGLGTGPEKLKLMVAENIENATYLYEELVKLYGYGNVYYPYQFNVMFPKPSKAIARKYQLMLTGERATICVLTNVTKKLINKFINDLKREKEKSMSTTNIKADYSIKTLEAAYAESAIHLFVKSFCESEPITKHLGIGHDHYEPFAREVVQKAVHDGLSKVALDKNKKVIACCIAEDITDPFLPKIIHYAKLKPVFSLLDKLSLPFLSAKTFTPGKVAHVWIAAVDPSYRGQGLSTAIDMACAEILARKGYDFVYAEFTNEISEKIINQYNLYQLRNKINYDDFVMENGQKPYAGLPGSATSYVIVIRPGVKLDAIEHYYQNEKISS